MKYISSLPAAVNSFLVISCPGSHTFCKKSLTGNNRSDNVAASINGRISTWRTFFQTALPIIIGTIFTIPVCLGCAEKIPKINQALKTVGRQETLTVFLFSGQGPEGVKLIQR